MAVIAAASSIPTRSAPCSAGWSQITEGTGRASAAAKCGSSSGMEYATKPSTEALDTAKTSSESGRAGTSSRPTLASSHSRVSPSRNATAPGSRNAYDTCSVSSNPMAPALRVRSDRATGSGPG